MGNDFEKSNRLENPEFVGQIRSQFADEWEEVVTGKGFFNEEDFAYVDKIRAGERVPKEHKWLRDKLIRIGQDYRLTPEEIDRLQEIFLI
ncbi:MAG: hypothetical protein AAB617_02435 [Patescibacteria group bacterium]